MIENKISYQILNTKNSFQKVFESKNFQTMPKELRQSLASWMRSRQENRVPDEKIIETTSNLINFLSGSFVNNFEKCIHKIDENNYLEPSLYFVTVTYNPLLKLRNASPEHKKHVLDTSQAVSSSFRVTKSNEYQARFFEHLFRHTVKSYDKHPSLCPYVYAFLDKKRVSVSIGEELFHTHAIVIVPEQTRMSFDAYFADEKHTFNHPLLKSVQTVDCQRIGQQTDLLNVFSYASKYFMSQSANLLGCEAKSELFDMYGPVKRGERIARIEV